MNAGQLGDRITLERLQKPPGGVEQWLPIAQTPDCWAAVEPLGGAGRYRVRIRYRADLASLRNVEPAMRVVFGAQVLDIEDVVEVDRGVEVHLFCKDVIEDAPALATGGRRIKAWAG